MATSSVEDAEAEIRVQGEVTEPVPDTRTPVSRDDQPFSDEPEFIEMSITPKPGHHPVDLSQHGLESGVGLLAGSAIVREPGGLTEEPAGDSGARVGEPDFDDEPAPAPDEVTDAGPDLADHDDTRAEEPDDGLDDSLANRAGVARVRRGRARVAAGV
jgi:single-strand DNA-binding protein